MAESRRFTRQGKYRRVKDADGYDCFVNVSANEFIENERNDTVSASKTSTVLFASAWSQPVASNDTYIATVYMHYYTTTIIHPHLNPNMLTLT